MYRHFILSLALIPLLLACSGQRALEIALKDEPKQSRPSPAATAPDDRIPLAMYQQFLKRFQDRLESEWGDREVLIASRHHYVKYTQNYQSRAIVDFDKGIITIETLDKRPLASLRQALITTLLTPDDPNAVDLFSTKEIELSGRPFLYGLVRDQKDKPIDTQTQADKYARHVVNNQRQSRKVKTADGNRMLHSITLNMVSNHVNLRAQRFAHLVERYATQFKVSKSLIYAVMKTESNFNLFAVSSAPAYGLMQLVPSTGGRDAYRLVKGQDGTPSQEYLFDANNNIELGTAYLSILTGDYLAGIKNPISREYCTIAAYNGGIGSVLRSFADAKDEALHRINSLTPAQVHDHLTTKHPAGETRRYLAKVLSAKREFVNL
jgi:membrane-bound lytic murein transglycosylase C